MTDRGATAPEAAPEPTTQEGLVPGAVLEDVLAEAVEVETGLVAPRTEKQTGGRTEGARFLRFLVTGGLAAAANVAARWLLGFALPFEAAVALAYLVGMTTAFALARAFVFDAGGGAVGGQYVRFALVNVVAFCQVWLVSVALARFVLPAIGWTWQADTLAHAIGVASPVATSYVFHKRFSFRA